MIDYILNGQAHGSLAARMMAANFDKGILRPFIGEDGRSYITVNTGKRDKGGKPVYVNKLLSNAQATLRKDEWIQFDTAAIQAARPRLKAFADLAASNTYTIAGGMGKTVLESQSVSDISPATISMDGLHRSDNDRPLFDIAGVPLPFIHKDFRMSARQVAVSRNSGEGLDTTDAVLGGIKVAETVEQLAIGTVAGYKFGGYTVYGYTNWPYRITASLTNPTTGGWNGDTLLSEVLAMRDASVAAKYHGPWKLYVSPNFSAVLDSDYSPLKGDLTLRERILKTDGITGMSTLDFLTGYQMLLIQMSPEVCRAVIAMQPTTIQWEQQGGMEICLKILCIMVPQLRTDFYGNTGIVHAAA